MQSVSKATKTVFTKQGRTLPCFLYDSLVSTNDEAKRIIREGGEDCFAVCALEQTGGRGRYSRPFLSLRGKGLYITFAIRADEIGPPRPAMGTGISPRRRSPRDARLSARCPRLRLRLSSKSFSASSPSLSGQTMCSRAAGKSRAYSPKAWWATTAKDTPWSAWASISFTPKRISGNSATSQHRRFYVQKSAD